MKPTEHASMYIKLNYKTAEIKNSWLMSLKKVYLSQNQSEVQCSIFLKITKLKFAYNITHFAFDNSCYVG